MIYQFDQFELDLEKVELRASGEVVPVEPQVFALLRFLIENRDRAVTKDEIIEAVWDGRIVSDSALSSRIKSARQALGDDGASQRMIRTIHRVGFRFVANTERGVQTSRLVISANEPQPVATTDQSTLVSGRPTIAVLPFRLVGIAGPYATLPDALPDELIAQLSRLRWLFVISRGSSFKFRGGGIDMNKVRGALNVRYCLSGVMELTGESMIVTVELADTESGGVLWGEAFHSKVGGVHEIREEIVRAIVGALELQIPLNEARRARMTAPEKLDAWSTYHLAQQHMFRFNKTDNAIATELLQRAIALEPTFARAHAGLSFTAFQDSFLRYVPNADRATQDARRHAETALALDPLDPFANFTMGRSFWLEGDIESSLPWLDRANTLNPNYAQGRYARAFTDPLLGNGVSGQAHADAARALSPLDPMLYAMLAGRAFSHAIRGELSEAVLWIDRARRSPGAHVLIDLIAAVMHGMYGDDAVARQCAEIARSRAPTISKDDFFRAFPFRTQVREQFAATLTKYGF